MNIFQSAFIPAACFLAITSSVLAAEERVIEDDKGIFNIVIENDIFAGAAIFRKLHGPGANSAHALRPCFLIWIGRSRAAATGASSLVA